jgi:exodeoxyribonuclease-3
VRIATWNVNSLKARLPRVEEWLEYAQPDVLCMQETKLADEAFPAMAFKAAGYDVAYHGEGRWNGVAIASRVGIEDFVAGMSPEEEDSTVEARLCSATCNGVRVVSIYVPNGREVGHEHYEYKLKWLAEVGDWLAARHSPADLLAVCGDYNIAPEDRDVYDPKKFIDATHVSAAERDALARWRDWGLVDTFRLLHDEPRLYSWWDYRAGDFHQGRGMRIDHVYATPPLAERARFTLIDRFARKGKLPSDHAPLFVDFDLA